MAHFKEDFMLKIRSAIKEAMQRKDELNKIISKLDFGKDKYQFIFTKNKGPDGKVLRYVHGQGSGGRSHEAWRGYGSSDEPVYRDA